MSKADYLKKYLAPSSSGGGDYEEPREKKKKRKRDKHSRPDGMRIIDDDLAAGWGGRADVFAEEEEEKPQIDGNAAADVRSSRPPPARSARHDSPDPSPPRRRERHDSPDPSPPRRGSDPSPPRRGRDPSPPRRRERHDSPDPSPPRRGRDRHVSPDPSPPRRVMVPAGATLAMPPPPPPGARAMVPAGGDGGTDRPAAMDSSSSTRAFSTAGLHKNVASEAAALVAQQAVAAQQQNVGDAMALGAGEDTVYRDRKGRKLEMLSQMMKGQEGGPKAPSTAPTWGSGLAQQRQKDEKRARARDDAAGPLARYSIDAETDAEKRGAMRFDDPMAQHLSKKGPVSNKPKYRGPPPPANRFNMPPGFRWDGVDRSNGYEKQYFLAKAKASTEASDAHAWATADM